MIRKAVKIILELKKRIERSNYGLHNIEAIIWMPIFLLVLAIAVNSAMVNYNESKLLRVVQNANHLLAVGELTSEAETEDFIIAKLSEFSKRVVVESVVDQGLIVTTLRVPVSDIMPTGLANGIYSGTVLTVSAQQAIGSK